MLLRPATPRRDEAFRPTLGRPAAAHRILAIRHSDLGGERPRAHPGGLRSLRGWLFTSACGCTEAMRHPARMFPGGPAKGAPGGPWALGPPLLPHSHEPGQRSPAPESQRLVIGGTCAGTGPPPRCLPLPAWDLHPWARGPTAPVGPVGSL